MRRALALAALMLSAPLVARATADGYHGSTVSGTQGNYGDIGIGVGYVGGGPYLDETGVRKNGLHATLDIAVEGAPKVFVQPDVHEGQTVTAPGYYRLLVEKIVPEPYGHGTVLYTLWFEAAPKAPKPWWRRLLHL